MFKEIPVKNPRKNGRLVFGVGINDAPYKTHIKINGKRVECPFYSKWHGMLKRSYYQPYKDKNRTYKDATVCDEWLTFSRFKLWMANQNWLNKELDKDLLKQGNKCYSPEACIFVSKEVNSIIVSNSKTVGALKAGVCLRKDLQKNKFKSSCSYNGKSVHLGYYETEDEAHNVYCSHKYAVIAELALLQEEPIKSALLRYKIKS